MPSCSSWAMPVWVIGVPCSQRGQLRWPNIQPLSNGIRGQYFCLRGQVWSQNSRCPSPVRKEHHNRLPFLSSGVTCEEFPAFPHLFLFGRGQLGPRASAEPMNTITHRTEYSQATGYISQNDVYHNRWPFPFIWSDLWRVSSLSSFVSIWPWSARASGLGRTNEYNHSQNGIQSSNRVYITECHLPQ